MFYIKWKKSLPKHFFLIKCDGQSLQVDFSTRENVSQEYNKYILTLLRKKLFFKVFALIETNADLSIETEKKFLHSLFESHLLMTHDQFRKCIEHSKIIHIDNLSLYCLLNVLNKNYGYAIKIARLIINNSKVVNEKAKAYYIIGSIYCDIWKQKIKGEYYFQQGAQLKNCLYSLICYLAVNKKPIKYTLNSNYKPVVDISKRDYIFLRLKQLAQDKKDQDFSRYTYSIYKEDFLQPSLALVNLLGFLSTLHNKSYILQMVLTCYRKTGIILRDYFYIPHELLHIHYKNNITLKDIFICFSIMSQESRFYSYKLESSKGALGNMQIMQSEAQRICRQHNIKYSKSLTKDNLQFNIVICLQSFKENAKFVGGNKVLAILYYHSGTMAIQLLKILQNTTLLNSKFGLIMSLEFINTPIANMYVKGVIETFILCNMCCNQRVLTLEDLYFIF